MSKVWNYFKVSENDVTKAVCVLCKSEISRGGTGKTASTSAMLKHLKFKHNGEYCKITNENNHSTKTAPKQTKLDYVKWEITNTHAMKIHRKIGQMIALDNQPFTIVTDTGKFYMCMK